MSLARRIFPSIMAMLLVTTGGRATAQADEITIPGPQGPLAATFLAAKPHGSNTTSDTPVALIIPGSGPTDRDGNNTLGPHPSNLRLLAEGLAAEGISSARIDKRGMFGSHHAIQNGDDVTISDYVTDVGNWTTALRRRTGSRCIWLIGHSEGGLVALATAQKKPADLCGLVLLSTASVPITTLLSKQLHANPANTPLFPQIDSALARIGAGKTVDDTTLPTPLLPLFRRSVQNYLIDLSHYDPKAIAHNIALPMLIIQGGRDRQVPPQSAADFGQTAPKTHVLLLPQMTHMLKDADAPGPAAEIRTYKDPDLPLSSQLVPIIADFISGH